MALSEHSEKLLAELNAQVARLVRLERMKALDNNVKRVWFDNISCKIFIPDAADDRIQGIILNTGSFFEEALLRRIKKYIKRGDVVVDAGANIGNHSLFFLAACSAGHVLSFEPQARLAQIIEKNLAINDFTSEHATVYNCGLGDKETSMSPTRSNIGNLGATQFSYDDNGEFKVIRLDDINIPHVDFMKIDVERMADFVIRGSAETLRRCSPLIWVELYGDEEIRAVPLLAELGYTHSIQLSQADKLFSKTPLPS